MTIRLAGPNADPARSSVVVPRWYRNSTPVNFGLRRRHFHGESVHRPSTEAHWIDYPQIWRPTKVVAEPMTHTRGEVVLIATGGEGGI